jgi:hypothetical protein
VAESPPTGRGGERTEEPIGNQLNFRNSSLTIQKWINYFFRTGKHNFFTKVDYNSSVGAGNTCCITGLPG